MGAVDTTKVTGRRSLHFNCLDDIAADVERLASANNVQALGNWSAGEVVQHVAVAMHKSIDGFTERPPAPVRVLLRLFLKKRILTKPMSAGFKLPARAAQEMFGPPIPLPEALKNLQKALARLKAEAHREPHPAFGPLTREEWDQLHCRHSALHLSFLVPA